MPDIRDTDIDLLGEDASPPRDTTHEHNRNGAIQAEQRARRRWFWWLLGGATVMVGMVWSAGHSVLSTVSAALTYIAICIVMGVTGHIDPVAQSECKHE